VSHSVSDWGEDILLAMSELPDGLGALYMRAPVSDVVGKYVEQLRRLVLYAGFVAVIISLLVALLLAERMSGPLRSMRKLAARMADGDFSQRVRISTPDEIGALGRSFDSLADSLEGTLARLSGERARLRGILASVTEGIIAVDAEGKVALINPQAAELLKLDPHASMGNNISGLAVPAEASSAFRDCLAANELRSVEMEVDQPRRYLTLHVAPVRADQEGEWGAVGVLRDVSEARRLDQMRSRFISDASHEIRTPLTAIGGFATAIADGTAATDEERTRGATLIVREVQRLNRLTNDLLDLSRIESGAAPLDLQPISVREVIGDVVDSIETQIRENELNVELDLPRDLPKVWADPDRLYQVLLNLVSNAIHFNSPRGRITFAARVTGSQVRVDVSDTGAGIPADELPHIWERFHRADVARTREAGGTGLGLAIVRSIVTAHGGEVSADSVLGEGTTLTFTVPVHSSTTPVES
jgi:PAS domain S-box-containing protein